MQSQSCWHCHGKLKCGCIACASETGPGLCVVCSGKAQWDNMPSEGGNAGQHNAIMRRRFLDYIERTLEWM